jgi:hypothetical protein
LLQKRAESDPMCLEIDKEQKELRGRKAHLQHVLSAGVKANRTRKAEKTEMQNRVEHLEQVVARVDTNVGGGRSSGQTFSPDISGQTDWLCIDRFAMHVLRRQIRGCLYTDRFGSAGIIFKLDRWCDNNIILSQLTINHLCRYALLLFDSC